MTYNTTELLKYYLHENTKLSLDKINEIFEVIPTAHYERSFSSDIEIDGVDDSIGQGCASVTKEEMGDKMRKIADDFNDKWKAPRDRIVSDYKDAPQPGYLTRMLNTYFQSNQLAFDDNQKAAFALKCLADITNCGSQYASDAVNEVRDLVHGCSL